LVGTRHRHHRGRGIRGSCQQDEARSGRQPESASHHYAIVARRSQVSTIGKQRVVTTIENSDGESNRCDEMEVAMAILSRIRRLAFMVILVGTLLPATTHGNAFGDDPPCPDGDCRDCETSAGFCWLPYFSTCGSYGCDPLGGCVYNEGAYTLCYCSPCA
jgi:hypothetical protein